MRSVHHPGRRTSLERGESFIYQFLYLFYPAALLVSYSITMLRGNSGDDCPDDASTLRTRLPYIRPAHVARHTRGKSFHYALASYSHSPLSSHTSRVPAPRRAFFLSVSENQNRQPEHTRNVGNTHFIRRRTSQNRQSYILEPCRYPAIWIVLIPPKFFRMCRRIDGSGRSDNNGRE
jgi:hypothetical protein